MNASPFTLKSRDKRSLGTTIPPPSSEKSPASSRPLISYVTCSPVGVVSTILSPTFLPLPTPLLVSTTTPSSPSWPKVAAEPSFQSALYSEVAAPVSMPMTGVVPVSPWTFADAKRTAATLSTPGTSLTAVAACSEIGVNPSWLTTMRLPAGNVPSTERSIEPRRPAAKIATNATSATPIMSAAAVTAVRPGLRSVFSRARRPVIPKTACSGRPTSAASGRTSSGLSIATDRKTTSAPRPMSPAAEPPEVLPNSPMSSSATPSDARAARR